MTPLEAIDARLFHAINGGPHAPWTDAFFVFLSAPPQRFLLFAALLALLLLAGGKRRWAALATLLAAVLVADQLSSGLLKPWIGRERPCFALEDVRLLFPRQAHSGSFPSSHAANTFAVAVVLLFHWRGAGWIALAGAALVGYSRIYVGVHYPLDVLAGALLGSLVGVLAARLEGHLLRRIAGRRTAVSERAFPGETTPDGR